MLGEVRLLDSVDRLHVESAGVLRDVTHEVGVVVRQMLLNFLDVPLSVLRHEVNVQFEVRRHHAQPTPKDRRQLEGGHGSNQTLVSKFRVEVVVVAVFYPRLTQRHDVRGVTEPVHQDDEVEIVPLAFAGNGADQLDTDHCGGIQQNARSVGGVYKCQLLLSLLKC